MSQFTHSQSNNEVIVISSNNIPLAEVYVDYRGEKSIKMVQHNIPVAFTFNEMKELMDYAEKIMDVTSPIFNVGDEVQVTSNYDIYNDTITEIKYGCYYFSDGTYLSIERQHKQLKRI
jgi:methyl coenzyme M reductase subunit C-like uncharacterized protein (methanogenesis marker protein 7)